MLDLNQPFVNAQADWVLADPTDEGRRQRLEAIRETALRENAPIFVVMVGHVLFARHDFTWANAAFRIAAGMPAVRDHGLFELAQVASFQSQLPEAIALMRQLESEIPLDAYRQRAFAHMLGRAGDLRGCRGRLDAVFALDPASLRDCLAQRQFAEYYNRFPPEEARRRFLALESFYPVKSSAEIVAEVQAALREGRPYSMVRLNDGEGSCLTLSLDDEAEFTDLYWLNRSDFHRVYWFGHDGLVDDPGWMTAMRDVNNSLASADAIGAHHLHSLGEYTWGSVRNVPSIFNIARKLEQMQETVQPGRISICHPQIHQQVLFHGLLEPLLRSQSRIGLVAAHPTLPDLLRRRYGIEEVVFHETAGEPIVGKTDLDDFGGTYRRICAELQHAEAGLLYIVCAGVPAKVYCELIKRAGGVAMDLGSVADVWMGVPSRGYYVDTAPFVLTGQPG